MTTSQGVNSDSGEDAEFIPETQPPIVDLVGIPTMASPLNPVPAVVGHYSAINPEGTHSESAEDGPSNYPISGELELEIRCSSGSALSLEAFPSPYQSLKRWMSQGCNQRCTHDGSLQTTLEVFKNSVNPAVTRITLMHQGTKLSPCHKALTLVGKGVRIEVADLTPFFPIRPIGISS
ncbi:hypothetical protein PIB30_051876 [Stylosanthes scabra]|uniref:Uncharacterized protein n=1 Tax=Stylosanthes scabra TaxID=79078 RepID=A0ABU6TIG1_9FABA|nr:hypothetical protein [Stylosanthes scabra]